MSSASSNAPLTIATLAHYASLGATAATTTNLSGHGTTSTSLNAQAMAAPVPINRYGMSPSQDSPTREHFREAEKAFTLRQAQRSLQAPTHIPALSASRPRGGRASGAERGHGSPSSRRRGSSIAYVGRGGCRRSSPSPARDERGENGVKNSNGASAVVEDDEDEDLDEAAAAARRERFLSRLYARTHEDYMDALTTVLGEVPIYTPPPPNPHPQPQPSRDGSPSLSPTRVRRAQQDSKDHSRLHSLLSNPARRSAVGDGCDHADVMRSSCSQTHSPPAPRGATPSPFRALAGPGAPIAVDVPRTSGSTRVLHTRSPNATTPIDEQKAAKPAKRSVKTRRGDGRKDDVKDGPASMRSDVTHPTKMQSPLARSSSLSMLTPHGATAPSGGGVVSPLSSPGRGDGVVQGRTMPATAQRTKNELQGMSKAKKTRMTSSDARVSEKNKATRGANAAADNEGEVRQRESFQHARRTLELQSVNGDDHSPTSTAHLSRSEIATSKSKTASEGGTTSRRRLLAEIRHYERCVIRYRTRLQTLSRVLEKDRDEFLAGVDALLARRQRATMASTTTTTDGCCSSTRSPVPLSAKAAASTATNSCSPPPPRHHHHGSSSGSPSYNEALSSTLPSRGGLGSSTQTLEGSDDTSFRPANNHSKNEVEAAVEDVSEKLLSDEREHQEQKTSVTVAPVSLSSSLPSSGLASIPHTSPSLTSSSSSSSAASPDASVDGVDELDLQDTESAVYPLMLRAQETIIATVDLISHWRAATQQQTHKMDTDADGRRYHHGAPHAMSSLTDLLSLPARVEEQRQRSQTLADVPLPLELRVLLQSVLDASDAATAAAADSAGARGIPPLARDAHTDVNTGAPAFAAPHVSTKPPTWSDAMAATTADLCVQTDPATWRLMRLSGAGPTADRANDVTAVLSGAPTANVSHAQTQSRPEHSWSVSTATTSIPIVASATLRAAAVAATAINSPASAYAITTTSSSCARPTTVYNERVKTPGRTRHDLTNDGRDGTPAIHSAANASIPSATTSSSDSKTRRTDADTASATAPPIQPYTPSTPGQQSLPLAEDEFLSVSCTTSRQSAATAAFSPYSCAPDHEKRVGDACEAARAGGTTSVATTSATAHQGQNGADTVTTTSAAGPQARSATSAPPPPLPCPQRPQSHHAHEYPRQLPDYAATIRASDKHANAVGVESTKQGPSVPRVYARPLLIAASSPGSVPQAAPEASTGTSLVGDEAASDEIGSTTLTTHRERVPPPTPSLPAIAMDRLLRAFYRVAREEEHAWARERQALLRTQAEAYERVVAAQATSAEARAAALALERQRRRTRIRHLRQDCADLYALAMSLDAVAVSCEARDVPQFVRNTVAQGRYRAAHRLYEGLQQQETEIAASVHSPPRSARSAAVGDVSATAHSGRSTHSNSRRRGRHASSRSQKDSSLVERGDAAHVHEEAKGDTHRTSEEGRSSEEGQVRTTVSTPSERSASPRLGFSPRGSGWGSHSFAASLSARTVGSGSGNGCEGTVTGATSDPNNNNNTHITGGARGGGGALSAYEHYQKRDWPARVCSCRTTSHASSDGDDKSEKNASPIDTEEDDAVPRDDITRLLGVTSRGGAWCSAETSNSSGAAAPGADTAARTCVTRAAIACEPALLPPSSRTHGTRGQGEPHTQRRALRLCSSAVLHSSQRLVDLGAVLQRAQHKGGGAASPCVGDAPSDHTRAGTQASARPRASSIPCTPKAPGAPPPSVPRPRPRLSLSSSSSPKLTGTAAPPSSVQRSASWSGAAFKNHGHRHGTHSVHCADQRGAKVAGAAARMKTSEHTKGATVRTTPFLLHDLDFIYTPSHSMTPSGTRALGARTRPTSADAFTLGTAPRAAWNGAAAASTSGRPPRPSSAMPAPLGSTYQHVRASGPRPGSRSGHASRAIPSLTPTTPQVCREAWRGGSSGVPCSATCIEKLQLEGQKVLSALPSDVRERVLRRAPQ